MNEKEVTMGNPKIDAMSEGELVVYYEENKDNPALWQKTPRKIRSRRGQGPSSVFTLRLTAEELEELALAASARGVSLTEFIRNTSLNEARSNYAHGGRPAATTREQ